MRRPDNQQRDVSRGRVIMRRWLALAEDRLDYLTELFETGRWRRYFSETAFLENVREAKMAVETWRLLASQEALPDNTPVDLSWLDSKRPLRARQPLMLEVPNTGARLPTFALTQPTQPTQPIPDIRIAPPPQPAAAPVERAASVEAIPTNWEHAFDVAAMAQRYPLLRNAV